MYFRLAEKQRGVHHLADPPSKIQIAPQQAVAGVGSSKSGVGTDEAVTCCHVVQSDTSAPTFYNVIIPSTPTPPNFTPQLFLDFLFSQSTIMLFFVHFSLLVSIDFFHFWPDGQISSQPV